MIWFVVNRTSGNGKGAAVWKRVEARLKERGIEYGCRFTERPGHAAELAGELARQSGTVAVVAIGGDGTVHEAASGLVGSGVPIGCIPAGSGDDFARSLGIPRQWEAALERVLRLASRAIDVGMINGQSFVISAGIGFDGDVARITNRSWYKRWLNKLGFGSLSYVVTVLRLVVRYRPCRVRLEVDGWLIAIANMPYYGGGMKICPDARMDDGMLHLCLVEGIGRLELLRFFPRVFNGTHVSHRSVQLMSGRQIRIESTAPMTIHTDGEYGGATPAAVDVQSGRLNVL